MTLELVSRDMLNQLILFYPLDKNSISDIYVCITLVHESTWTVTLDELVR